MARGVRGFADGTVSVALASYLTVLGSGLSVAVTGALFLWMGLLSALSAFLSVSIARHIGLVFTHMPAQAFLIAAALMPSVGWAIACLLARSLLSAMYVPAWNSYVMTVVKPQEVAVN